jgi:hypothetical protein
MDQLLQALLKYLWFFSLLCFFEEIYRTSVK